MIYGYVRISTTKQEKGNSKENQSNAILARYPEATIIEETYSGAKERPKFLKLLTECKNGDTIAVTKLDRFCRSTKEGLEYIDFLKSKSVNVHILNMGLIEDTPMGRLIVTNLRAFAEFERALIKERTDKERFMKASKAVKEIMNEQNVTLSKLASRMNKSLRLVSDRLRADNITTKNLVEMLRNLDYELVVVPRGKINKSDNVYFITDEEEK